MELHCLESRHALGKAAREKAKYYVVGVGWDSTATGTPGQRFGPAKIREHAPAELRGDARVYDVGDLNVVHGDYEETARRLRDCVARMFEVNENAVPVFLGGDHSLTYHAFRAVAEKHAGAAVVCFDAHPDVWAEYSDKLHHGDWLNSLVEEGSLSRAVVVGVRKAEESEKKYLAARGERITVVWMEDIKREGVAKAAEKLEGALRGVEEIYLSLDIDVLDPVEAPGTGTPEAGGLTEEALTELLRVLSDKVLVGADLVEVNPLVEGERTPRLAGRLLAACL